MQEPKELDIEKAGDDARKLVLLASALKAGIFEALAEEKDIASLKRELDADERALYIVLEALCAMGYVNKTPYLNTGTDNDRYVIADKAVPVFLTRGKEYAGFLPHFLNIMKAWLELPDIIKGQKPEKVTPHDVAAFMHAMASRADKFVEDVVNYCLKRKNNARNVLDLGGGPGKYARAFVKKGLNAVLYDLPETIDYVGIEFGLKDIKNLTLRKGDFTKNGFEKEFTGSFDIIFMGNICHIYSEEENKKLIKRVSKILKKDGLIAIEDFVRGRSPSAEMFAVNMLANTEGGNTYTEAQYRGWLEEAGFHSVDVIDLDEREKQLITGFI